MKSSCWQNHFQFLFFAFIIVNALSAFAGPGRTTYQAKIIKPDGYPLEASSVNFKFTILDPAGSCILYSETYSAVNMGSTSGLISFSLGSGVKTYPVSSPTFEDVFSNITASLSCDAGGPGSYSPASSDIRKIVMQFHDGTGWQTLPAMNINAVPYAMYANNAQQLAGLNATDFVQVSTVPTCAASEALRFNGANFLCVAVATGVTSSTVITALGYTPADGASLTTVVADVSSVSATIASVSSTVFSVSSTVTSLSQAVSAITSSQWVTSGTAISYATGNVGIGTSSPWARLIINDNNAEFAFLDIDGAGEGTGAVFAINNQQGGQWSLRNNDNGDIALRRDSAGARNFLIPDGNVGIGTTTPVTKLEVSGGVRISMESATCAVSYAGTLRYNAGNVEYCNGTTWSAFGVSGAGLQSFNGSASGTQSFANGTTGTAPLFVTANGLHTLNIPLASAGSVTAGLISNADYTSFSNKITSSAASIAQVLGYVPASSSALGNYLAKANNLSDLTSIESARTNLGLGTFATANTIDLGSASATGTLAVARLPAFNGDATIAAASNTIILSNSGVTAGTYTKLTVDNKGRVTSSSALASNDVTTALGYTPASASASTQWTTSGTNIHYASGNVGIGTTTFGPNGLLQVNGDIGLSGNRVIRPASNADTDSLKYFGNQVVVGEVQSAAYNYSGGSLLGVRSNLDSAKLIDVGRLDTANNLGKFLVQNSTGGNVSLSLVNATGSATLFSDTLNGNVGIGTTSPAEKLEVSGALKIGGIRQISDTGDAQRLFLQSTSSNTSHNIAVVPNGVANSGIELFMTDGYADRVNIESLRFLALPGSSEYRITTAAGGAGSLRDVSFYQGATQVMTLKTSGSVGIGTSSPTARLQIAAGTSATPSIKLTSGTLTTTPQAGAMEYDGSAFYLTEGSLIRRTIATGSSAGTIDNASTINSTGNMSLVPVGSVIVSSTTASTNSSTGALVVNGGLGVAENLNVAGTISGSARVLATGFRANQGVPNASDSSTNGYAFGADGDTGLFSPGAGAANGVVAIYSNNVERMRVDVNGNVGIGTSNPTNVLDVSGAAVVSGGLGIGTSATAGVLMYMKSTSSVSDIVVVDRPDASPNLDFYSSYNGLGNLQSGTFAFGVRPSQDQFQVWERGYNSNWTNLFAITKAGNVGIGTANPVTKLDVVGTRQNSITTSNAIFKFGGDDVFLYGGAHDGVGGPNYPIMLQAMRVSDSLAFPMVLNPNGGSVGINTLIPTAALDVSGTVLSSSGLVHSYTNNPNSNPHVTVTAGPNAAFPVMQLNDQRAGGRSFNIENGRLASGTFAIRDNAAGSERFVIMPTGNIGIGTNSPSEKLEVNGNIKLTGNLIANSGVAATMIYIKGTGLHRSASRTVQVGNSMLVNNGGRGLNLTILNKSDYALVSTVTYDTYGSTVDSDNLAIALNGVTNTQIGILTSFDSWEANVTTNLKTAFARLGLMKAYYPSYRQPYASIFEGASSATVTTAKVVEMASNNDPQGIYAEISGWLVGGTFAVTPSSHENTLFNPQGDILAVSVNQSGNVGIGTSSPLQLLHITNGSGSSADQTIAQVGSGAGSLFLTHNQAGISGNSKYESGWKYEGSGYASLIHFYTTGKLSFQTAPTGNAGDPVSFNERMVILNDSGNVGIGTSSPEAKLDIFGSTYFASRKGYANYYNAGPYDQMEFGAVGSTTSLSLVTSGVSRLNIDTSGNVGIGTASPGYKLDVSGDIRITGTPYRNGGDSAWIVPSDARLKDVVSTYDRGLREIANIDTIIFSYKKDNPKQIDASVKYTGVLAQQVQQQIPEAVKVEKDGFLSLNTTPIFWAMVNAIKELYHDVLGLKAENAEIKAENAKLKERLDRLEKALQDKK